ncbi:hypothetical protein [Chenggangzhangella methanolivorans]|uniref:Uncharacterized protein n=1 Tax=Chenggangzhangella methanolivorans TaxID=1437009 RepID=A0A9E6RE71_9HYPH|nr:hypothetical protein [Chenggangzhangella methanolivorans]QZN99540.1 hypothetical protein K6K41_22990 [Chenggangzhangella methanolivorans]
MGPAGPAGAAGAPKRVERYTATTNAAGVAVFSWTACAAPPDVQVLETWSGDAQIGGSITAQSLGGATVLAKVSRGTLLLSAGPFQTAAAGVAVTVRVIC